MPNDIREFFGSYRDAFDRLDPKAISMHFDVPCLIANQNGPAVFLTQAEVLSNCAALADHYRKNFYSHAEFECCEVIPQSEFYAVANLLWTIHRKEKQSLLRFYTTYNLRKLGNEWRVYSATAYEKR